MSAAALGAFGWAGSRNSGSAEISEDGDIPVNKVTTAIGEEPDSATSRVSALAANRLRRAGFDRNDASISLVSGRMHREWLYHARCGAYYGTHSPGQPGCGRGGGEDETCCSIT